MDGSCFLVLGDFPTPDCPSNMEYLSKFMEFSVGTMRFRNTQNDKFSFQRHMIVGPAKLGAHDAVTVLLLLPKAIVARCAWPHRGRSFQWEHCRYEKSMSYKNVCEIQKQWKIEVVRRSNEWANGCWDVNVMRWYELIDATESMHAWPSECVSDWGNERMIECASERTNNRTNELTMNGQINEQMA